LSQISNPALVPPGGLGAPVAPKQAPAEGRAPGPSGAQEASFADALKQADNRSEIGQQPLAFSRHALARVQRRGIDLDAATLGRLSEGVGRAAGKGSRDSVILVDGTAFVVSVANRTVITAVGPGQMKDNVFTNIDSAVIA
jgi:flagellar operon protein